MEYWTKTVPLGTGGDFTRTDKPLCSHIHTSNCHAFPCEGHDDKEELLCWGCRRQFPTVPFMPIEEALASGLVIAHVVFTREDLIDEHIIRALIELDDARKIAELAAIMQQGIHLDEPLVLAAAA
jgi:hypothetical protein